MAVVEQTPIWQRLRVAMIGLVIVSAAIFGANALIDQASDDPDLANANLQRDIAETGGENPSDETPSEPLVELGVTPVPKEDGPKDDGSVQPTDIAEPGANPVSEDEVDSSDDSLLPNGE